MRDGNIKLKDESIKKVDKLLKDHGAVAKMKNDVTKQLIVGKYNYKEIYDVFYKISKVVQDIY